MRLVTAASDSTVGQVSLCRLLQIYGFILNMVCCPCLLLLLPPCHAGTCRVHAWAPRLSRQHLEQNCLGSGLLSTPGTLVCMYLALVTYNTPTESQLAVETCSWCTPIPLKLPGARAGPTQLSSDSTATTNTLLNLRHCAFSAGRLRAPQQRATGP